MNPVTSSVKVLRIALQAYCKRTRRAFNMRIFCLIPFDEYNNIVLRYTHIISGFALFPIPYKNLAAVAVSNYNLVASSLNVERHFSSLRSKTLFLQTVLANLRSNLPTTRKYEF